VANVAIQFHNVLNIICTMTYFKTKRNTFPSVTLANAETTSIH